MAYKSENDPTSADAVPLYNDNILKFWNWFDSVWDCSDWMTWHKSMKAKYGKPQADSTFLHYWNDLATGSHAIDCRSLNASFRTYMKSEGLLDALFDGIGIIAEPIGAIGDVVSSVGSSVSNVGKAVENVTKVLKVAVPIMLIVAIAGGGFWAYKHFIAKK